MKMQAFAEILANESFYDSIIDENFWNQRVDTYSMLEATRYEAVARKITLENVSDFEETYDRYFFALYCDTEKGLS